MITRTTITLDDKVKKAGVDEATVLGLRGKFSEYVEMLIKADLAKKEAKKKSQLS